MEQNRLSERQIAEKDTINNKNLIEQTNFVSMIHMELQTTREDLYLLKSRLCHHCREQILDEAEDRMAMAQAVAQAQERLRQGGGGGSSSIMPGSGGMAGTTVSASVGPMDFDATGRPLVGATGGSAGGGAGSDIDKQRLEAELRRTRDALESLNRQLLEERGQRERREEEEQKALETEERASREVEEEARRRRARDERKIAAGEDIKTFTIRFMDGTRKKIDAFLSDTVGDIVQRICAKIGVRYSEMLHLAHSVNENSVLGAVDRFLDNQKTLEQEGITPKCTLVFKFKHYKRPRRWTDSVAQEWFFRQLHHNVVSEYYPTSEKLSVELAGLELQSIFGDASGKKRHSYFDRVGLDSYLPVSVSVHDYEYWQERLYGAHKRRRGLSAIESRQKYIDTIATKSPYWGMTFSMFAIERTVPSWPLSPKMDSTFSLRANITSYAG